MSKGTGAATKLKHKVNMPSVTEDEALELMIHHLSLAAAYYEAAPDNQETNLNEIKRMMDPRIEGYKSPSFMAALVWLTTLDRIYEEMEKVSKNAV